MCKTERHAGAQRALGPKSGALGLSPCCATARKSFPFLWAQMVRKSELNGSLNPAGTFYSSKIKFGFHKAAHLGRRTDLTNQRRVLLWPFPSLSPAFSPSLFSIRKQVLNFYYVLGPVRCSGLNCVPGHHPRIHRLEPYSTGWHLETGSLGSEEI